MATQVAASQEGISAIELVSELLKLYSVALVHERTVVTERPPVVGEVSAKFCGWKVSRGQRSGSLRP
jgi:hypothetical protein